MKPMREQDSLAQHPLIPCRELDFGDGESVTEMERTIHVGVREVPKPFGKLLLDFSG